MSLFHTNIEKIRTRHPEIFELFETKKCNSEEVFIVSEQSKDGNYYLTYQKKDVSIRLNSKYRPITEAKQWAEQYKIVRKLSVVYMFGLGNGYFVSELIKKLKSDSKLVIIEPSIAILAHVLTQYDLTDILSDDRVFLFLGEEDEIRFFQSLEQFVHWTNLASQIICIHPQYEKCFVEQLQKVEQILKNNNEKEIRNRNTEAYFGKSRVENTIQNFRYINKSYTLADLEGKIPRDIPAIIVAAGPSLAKNIDGLKRAKGHAFIIACDTSLRYMQQQKISPDIVITVDARKPLRYFENAGFEELPVLTTTTANYEVLALNHGQKLWFSGHLFQILMYEELGEQLSYRTGGGSVATAAFAVCSSLGFQRIILIGQDLAYEGDASHAGGEHNAIRNEAEGIRYVKGIDGTMVKTRSDWFTFLLWYQNAIKACRGVIEVIDATEGGAYIEGTTILPLKEVVNIFCKKDFNFEKTLYQLKRFEQKYGNKVSSYLKSAWSDLLMMEKEIDESMELMNEFLDQYEVARYDIERFRLIEQKVIQSSQKIQKSPVFYLVDEYARNETMELAQELCNTTEDEVQNQLHHFMLTKNILQELKIAVQKVKPMFEATLF